MNKKMNDKGFSLVELIVVIAIMAILAVTLAPRLTQYIERSRKASDQEVVNTIYTAAKLANAEFQLGDGDSIIMEGASAAGVYTKNPADPTKWTLNATYTETGHADFLKAMIAALSDFNLKSHDVEDDTTIKLTTDADGKITVLLDYTGNGLTDDDIQVTE